MSFMGIASTMATVGLLAGGGAVVGPAPAIAATAVAPSAFSVPTNDWHRWDRDHGRSWDGDRRGRDGWDGHFWGWWHDSGISWQLCRDGGGHVNWDKHRCEGGRFDDFHVR